MADTLADLPNVPRREIHMEFPEAESPAVLQPLLMPPPEPRVKRFAAGYSCTIAAWVYPWHKYRERCKRGKLEE